MAFATVKSLEISRLLVPFILISVLVLKYILALTQVRIRAVRNMHSPRIRGKYSFYVSTGLAMTADRRESTGTQYTLISHPSSIEEIRHAKGIIFELDKCI